MSEMNMVHGSFKLNGTSYSLEDLKEVGYSLIKEGEAHEQQIGDFILDWISDTNGIYVTTSGSTGKPQKIYITKESMVHSAKATAMALKLASEQLALLCLPTNFIAGKMMLVRAMVLGLHLDYCAPIGTLLNTVQKDYDFAAMTPMQAQNSLKIIPKIKKLIIGGAPVSSKLKANIGKGKNEVYETYGMTETVTHIALKELSPNASEYFTALPFVNLAIDTRNCLQIDAPKVSSGKIQTNDMVRLHSENVFEWIGRFDNVINSGGVKLHPELIERKLAPILNVTFFVAGMPDERLGQELVLIIENSKEDHELLQKIHESKTLEKYETPKKVYSLSKFIRTKNGKIQRSECLKLLQ